MNADDPELRRRMEALGRAHEDAAPPSTPSVTSRPARPVRPNVPAVAPTVGRLSSPPPASPPQAPQLANAPARSVTAPSARPVAPALSAAPPIATPPPPSLPARLSSEPSVSPDAILATHEGWVEPDTLLPPCLMLGATLPLLAAGWFALDPFSLLRANAFGIGLPILLVALGVSFSGLAAVMLGRRNRRGSRASRADATV